MAKMAAAGALITRSTLTEVSLMWDSRSCRARLGLRYGVGDQVAQLHPLEGGGMGGLEHDGRCHPRLEGLLPARCAQAPLVARLEPVEAELGMRGREVVADGGGEGQEVRRDPGADGVHAQVFGAGVATAVAVEAGQRVE